MSVIGGIYEGREFGREAAARISKAMICRGGEERRAFVYGDTWLLSGVGRYDAGGDAYCCRDGICAVADGRVWSTEGSHGADAAVEAYLCRREKLGEVLYGDFALALYDSKENKLVLLCDGKGGRPVFYTEGTIGLAFAGEIKGLLAMSDSAKRVDARKLRDHIFSPPRKMGAGFWSGIGQIPPAGGCVCTERGAEIFTYTPPSIERKENCDVITPRNLCPDVRGMENLLRRLLFAYDAPQFDPYMVGFISAVSGAAGRGESTAVYDGALCLDIDYAVERRDRLCSAFGTYVLSVPSGLELLDEEQLVTMERVTRQVLDRADTGAIGEIVGEDVNSLLAAERNLGRKIRLEGMLYQTFVWSRVYNAQIYEK